MLDKLFGENGIFGAKGQKYYQNQFEKKFNKLSENASKKKQGFKENAKGILITSYVLTLLLNIIFNTQYGYSLFSMLGMSLVEFPFAIPFGIITYNVYKFIKGDVNKKIDKEIKKIDEYNNALEKANALAENNQNVKVQTENNNVTSTKDNSQSNIKPIVGKLPEEDIVVNDSSNFSFIPVTFSETTSFDSFVQQETTGQQRVRRR
jgi:FtsZ-binding cell division protein ZapB